ncbi:hypothetical protein Tco_1418925 [Tanacetum coccineum]
MNQNYYEPKPCYNSNSSGVDQFQPQQYFILHQPPQETSTEMLQAQENLMEAIQAFLKKYDQIPSKEKSMALLLAKERFLKIKQVVEEEQNKPESKQELLLQISKDLQTLDEDSEQAAKVSSQYWKPPIYYDDDDDDEESFIPLRDIISELPLSVAITPDLPISDSLIMEEEHLNIIPETESDEENESSCDIPVCDYSSSKNKGLKDIVSISLGKEIDHLDTIPDSVQSFLNRVILIIFLIEEFTGKLAPIDPIPPGIVEADLEEDIRLIEKLLNDDSFPHSSEELNSAILMLIINLSPVYIPSRRADTLLWRRSIYFLLRKTPIPPGIENDDYDSEGDVPFLAELLNNDYISLPDISISR